MYVSLGLMAHSQIEQQTHNATLMDTLRIVFLLTALTLLASLKVLWRHTLPVRHASKAGEEGPLPRAYPAILLKPRPG
ncbi:MAG: hypothetical protein ACOYXN_00120 [Acidobacteriota bacterium]